MSDILEVGATINTGQILPGIQDLTEAMRELTAAMTAGFTQVGTKSQEASRHVVSNATEARHALHGLGEEIGIHVPRFVQTFVAHLGGVGPVLAAAFAPVAIIGLIEVLGEAGKKAYEFYENVVNLKSEMEALDAIEKKLTTDMIGLSNALLEGHIHLTQLTSGPIDAAKEKMSALGGEIIDLGKMLDTSGKQFKDLGIAARASLRDFLEPTQAKDLEATLGRVQNEMRRLDRLLLNTEQGTREYKRLQEALQALQSFYGVLALKVQKYNQDVQVAGAETTKAEKEEADKRQREIERLAKEAARLSHDRTVAELNDLAELAKEEQHLLGLRARENADFDKAVEEEIKKSEDRIKQLQEKALGEAVEAQNKALRNEEKIIRQRQQPYVELGRAVMHGVDSMIQGVLMGTQTVGQAFARLGANMLLVMAEALAKIYLKHLAHWLAVNVLEKIHMTQSIGTLIAGATVKQAVGAADAVTTTTQVAGAGSAAAFASVLEALPFPENVATAPGVAAAEFAQMMAIGLPKAERGALLDRDMPLYGHKGELMLPPALSSGVQRLVTGGGGASAPMNFSYAPTIHALDSRGVKEVLKAHSAVIIEILQREKREGRA